MITLINKITSLVCVAAFVVGLLVDDDVLVVISAICLVNFSLYVGVLDAIKGKDNE